jgi:PKD repeat protein
MRLLLLFIGLLLIIKVSEQCPVADFNVNGSACKTENLLIENNSTNASSYEWDFCSGDLSQNPTAQAVFSNSSLFRARSLRVVKSAEGSWYGFSIDEPNNTLVRLFFGTSLDNTPTLTSLANPSSALKNAFDLKFWNEGQNWYALVPNKTTHELLRLNFGSNLENVPTVDNLGTFSGLLQSPSDVEIVNEGSSVYAFITNSSSSPQVVKFDFGASIVNTPSASVFSVPGASNLRGISMIKECSRWFGLITSYSGNSLYYIDFENGITQAPVTGLLTIPSASYSFPSKVKIVNEGGEFVAFVQSASPAKVYRIIFGSSIVDKTGVFADLGNFSISPDNYALEIISENSKWRAFSIDLTGAITPGKGRLIRLEFPNNCPVDQPIQNVVQPNLQYAASGGYRIALKALTIDNATSYSFKDISVSNQLAPDISMESANQCANHDVQFASVNTSANITTYAWEFGDASTGSSSQNPIHQFSTDGDFNINLEVTASNSCKNRIATSIRIYSPPIASFSLPSGLLCTNSEFTFTNTTADIYEDNLLYQWFVGSSQVATTRDLKYVFESVGSKTIKLITSIPGCSSESVQVTSGLQAGAIIDFLFSGKCEDAEILFDSQLPDGVISTSWLFPQGETRLESDVPYRFANAGEYQVTLSATNSIGCNTTKTKSILVYAKPSPDFSIANPPQSCSGSVTPFTNLTPNLTDSNIGFWSWNFGDATSSLNTSNVKSPSHIFQLAGTYTVELKAKSDQGCDATAAKQITIAQSPGTDFTNTSTCLQTPSTFVSSAEGIKTYYWELGTSYYLTKTINHTFTNPGEQNVKLTVTANNNCTSIATKKIVVPIPLIPAISYWKNCVGYEAELTDNTTGSDPVAWRQWSISGIISENVKTAKFNPAKAEPLPVTLTVRGESGCVYSKRIDVDILKAPVAKFNITPTSGAIPLKVETDNLSEDASEFKWSFNDGTVTNSNDAEPSYSFTTIGAHSIELKATNDVGCESISSKTIDAQTPSPDVEIKLITVSQNPDKTLKVILTIQNNGNTIITDLPVKIDVSGDLLLTETVKGPLIPNEQYNLVLSYGIAKRPDMRFLCAQTELTNDLSTLGDRSCVQFDKEPLIMTPYPNPATDVLNIEWMSTSEHKVKVMITDGFGKALLQQDIEGSEGLNQHLFDVHELKAGIYFLVINDGSTVKTQRILISPKN